MQTIDIGKMIKNQDNPHGEKLFFILTYQSLIFAKSLLNDS